MPSELCLRPPPGLVKLCCGPNAVRGVGSTAGLIAAGVWVTVGGGAAADCAGLTDGAGTAAVLGCALMGGEAAAVEPGEPGAGDAGTGAPGDADGGVNEMGPDGDCASTDAETRANPEPRIKEKNQRNRGPMGPLHP